MPGRTNRARPDGTRGGEQLATHPTVVRYPAVMIDTHCHLDRVDDLASALDNDLRAMVTIGTDVPRSHAATLLAERNPRVYAVVGLHPNEASGLRDASVQTDLEALARHPRVVGLGETGFDDHWQDETLDEQRHAFDWHADVARRLAKPLVLHVRDRQGSDAASRAAERALRDTPGIRGVLHCFAGDPGLLAVALDAGWFVSFAGNLTFKRAHAIHDAALRVPDERLLVETDAPYLAPEPHRGKRNVPAWVHHTAERLAVLRGVSIDELEPILDANAARFYGVTFPVDGSTEAP